MKMTRVENKPKNKTSETAQYRLWRFFICFEVLSIRSKNLVLFSTVKSPTLEDFSVNITVFFQKKRGQLLIFPTFIRPPKFLSAEQAGALQNLHSAI